MIVIFAGIAFFVSRKWGRTKLQREVIFTLAGFIGLVVVGVITFARLRAGG